MKIYIASSFSLRGIVEALAYELEQRGHKITVKWWEKDFKSALGSFSLEDIK